MGLGGDSLSELVCKEDALWNVLVAPFNGDTDATARVVSICDVQVESLVEHGFGNSGTAVGQSKAGAVLDMTERVMQEVLAFRERRPAEPRVSRIGFLCEPRSCDLRG